MTKISNLYSLTNYITANTSGNIVISAPSSGYALDVTGTGRFTGAVTFGTATTNGNITINSNTTNVLISGATGYNRPFMALSWDVSPDAGLMIGNTLGFNIGATPGSGVGTRALTIASNGIVTASSGLYQSGASSSIASNRWEVYNGGSQTMSFFYNSSGSIVWSNGVDRATLSSGGVWYTTGGGTSDRRLKQNIEYIETSGIDSISLLKPAKFEFIADPEKTRRGFIAQDVLEVIPDLVLGDGELEDGTYGLDYDGILSLAVKAIQELSAKVTALENK